MIIEVAISPRGTAHAMEMVRHGEAVSWRAVCGMYSCRYGRLVACSGTVLPSMPCGACLRRLRTWRQMERKYLGPYGLWERDA